MQVIELVLYQVYEMYTDVRSSVLSFLTEFKISSFTLNRSCQWKTILATT